MNLSAIAGYYSLIHEHVWAHILVIVSLYIVATILFELFMSKVVRRLCAKTTTKIDDQIIDILQKPVYQTVLLIGIIHIVTLAQFSPPLTDNVARGAKSLIVLSWLATLINISNILTRTMDSWREKLGPDLLSLINKSVFLFLLFMALASLFSIWTIDLTPIIASAGVAGIAIALAAKDTLANFFGGISIFFDKVYRVGDYVIIDNKERGEVVEIGIRSTRIITRDDVLINIPNSLMATSKIINESAPYPQYRIKIPVGVAYGTDLELVENVLLDLAANDDQIVRQPFPRVRVRALGDSSVNIELLVWVNDPRDRGVQTHLFLKRIHKRFAEEGITIPFPQLDVHLEK